MLAGFKEEDVVAGVKICESIKGSIVVVRRFRIEFRVFVCMRQQGIEVGKEVTMATIP